MSVTANLSSFVVRALRGERTVNITFQDNRLILVGENGTGKSTIVNLLYLFLTQQWRRLAEYEFDSIQAILDDCELNISREILLTYSEEEDRIDRIVSRYSPSALLRLKAALSNVDQGDLRSNPDKITTLAREVGLPRTSVHSYISALEGSSVGNERLRSVSVLLTRFVTDQVLYLPTYRRIEQDLNAILRGPIRENSLRSERAPRFTDRDIDLLRDQFAESTKGLGHVELVQFGMEDVEKTVTQKMDKVKDNVRNGLNSLTGRYLREIIRGEIGDVDLSIIRDLDAENVDAVLARTGTILSHPDQRRLREIILEIKAGKSIDANRKIVAHFLTRIIEWYEDQQKQEKDVRDFARVCSNYLVGKSVEYDATNFSVYVQKDAKSMHGDDVSNNLISLRNLSSGEKQIVSLFCHIYLSGDERYFVILDEPETSLSVEWQRRLLPDVLATDRCVGLVAVTHSPFIYDNELDEYAHSLEEFTEFIHEPS